MALDQEVWIIYHANEKARLGNTRKRIRDECQRRGWNTLERQTSTERTNNEGRTRSILPRNDAANIYWRLHRARVAIVAFGNPHVFLHPEDNRNVTTLNQFCRYKCFYETAGSGSDWLPEDAQEFADRFESACSEIKAHQEIE